MKPKMEERDRLRNVARLMDRQEDWLIFRQARNKCCKDLKKCKNAFFRNFFGKIEEENYTKKLYKLTNNLLDTRARAHPPTICIWGEGG